MLCVKKISFFHFVKKKKKEKKEDKRKNNKKEKNNDTFWFLPEKDVCSPVPSPCSERCIAATCGQGDTWPNCILGFTVEGEKVCERVHEWMCCGFTWAYFKQPVLIYNFYSLFWGVVVGVWHFFFYFFFPRWVAFYPPSLPAQRICTFGKCCWAP